MSSIYTLTLRPYDKYEGWSLPGPAEDPGHGGNAADAARVDIKPLNKGHPTVSPKGQATEAPGAAQMAAAAPPAASSGARQGTGAAVGTAQGSGSRHPRVQQGLPHACDSARMAGILEVVWPPTADTPAAQLTASARRARGAS